MTLLRHLLLFCLALSAWAQGFDPVKDVGLAFRKGAVEVTAPEGSHLKAQFMKVEKRPGPGTLSVGPMPRTTAKDELDDPIWHGTVRIPLKGSGLKGPVVLAVTYQPCTEGEGGVCFPPTTRDLKVLAHEIPVLREEKKTAGPMVAVATAPKVEAAPAPTPKEEPKSKGWLLALLTAFGFGLGASLTPCVYPMIPITMAVIGAKGHGKARGFMLSLALVLGLAVTYTALGVVSAKLGEAAGSLAQRPAFLIPVSVFFALFALSLFGLFEIRLPAGLQARLQGDGPRQGFAGAFIMGLILGPISAPCVGPIVLTILTSIAQQGQVLFGALQLFVFALGMGVLFIAVGTFSAALPKSGEWLTRFKQGMGVVVLGFAAWNVRLLVPEWANFTMWSAVGLTASAVLGVFESATGMAQGLRRGLGILGLLCGLILGLRGIESGFDLELLPRGGMAAPKDVHEGWISQDFEGAKAKAKAEGKLVVIDLYADWCAACKELDEKTWPDPAVKEWLSKKAVALRLNTDKDRKDLLKPLNVTSYPLVIVLDSEGKELHRLGGFHNPQAMLAFLEGTTPAS